ncbi:MAG: outer membrane beta-barrel protein [Pseudomonadota bacterium]
MYKLYWLTIGCSVALASVFSPAKAADLDPPMQAASKSSIYGALRIIGAFGDDTSFGLDTAAAVPTDIDNAYDDFSFGGAIALGAKMGNGFRAEVEIAYGELGIDSHTITALPATLDGANAFGTTQVTTGLINAYYDLNMGTFTPYVTAGFGIAHVNFDTHGIVLAAPTAGLPAGRVVAMDDADTGYVWQVGVGTSIKLTETVDLEVGYRYSQIGNINLEAVDGTATNVDLSSHSVLAGFRVGF